MKSMAWIERRELLKTTGTGVALGAGAASAREMDTVETRQTTTFTATATSGFLTIDAGSRTTDDATLPLAGSAVDGDFVIEGEISPDGTWQSTSTSLPSFSETRDSGNIIVGDVTISINYFISGTVTGTIDRAGNVMTATMPLRIDLEVSGFPGGPAGDTIPADANDLTTESSGDMTGSASGLDTTSGSATLVDNEFTLPGTGTDLVDEVFGLPSQTSGRNWMELQFDIQFSDSVSIGTFTGTVTNQSGSPLSGIPIQVNDDSGTTVTTATTDSNGEYSTEVSPGTYDLVVSDPDYDSASETASVSDEETATVDFQVVAKPGTVEGTVFDISGPLGNEEVTLVDGDQTVDTAITSADDSTKGAYTLTSQPGQYDIVLNKDGYEPFEETVTVEANSTTNVQINLSPLPTLVVGQITDPDGDGLYEDVRGDGQVGILDVQALFNQLGTDLLSFHSEKFNFSGQNPDDVTILDVQALFNKINDD